MRSLSTAASNALASTMVPIAVLIEMQLTVPLRLTLADVSIEYGGYTWTGLGAAGGIDEVKNTVGDRSGISLNLSSVPVDMLVLALDEPMVGRTVRIYLLMGDPVTYVPITADQMFAGTLGQPQVAEGDGSGSVTVSAESREITFRRPKPVRYTDADQRRLYPDDTSLRFITSQANHQDTWPSAQWGRK